MVRNVVTGICLSGLVVAHIGLLSVSAVSHSPVVDEPAHVVSGLSHWQMGDYSLYRVNPPLARMFATLPIFLFEKETESWSMNFGSPGDFGRTEFFAAEQFFSQIGSKMYTWIFTARLTSALFSVLCLLICFAWGAELYGIASGLLAAAYWTISPWALGWGAIVTPDVPSAAMGILALYLFWRWQKAQSISAAYVAGVGLGLAELTKTSWIFLPMMLSLATFLSPAILLKPWIAEQFGKWLREVSRVLQQILIVLSVGWIVFCAGYAFDGMFEQLGNYNFRSSILRGHANTQNEPVGNRFCGTVLEGIPVPLPRQYLLGLDFHKADVEGKNEKLAYLRGELKKGGWWYYYLYSSLIKSTLGGLVLLFSATLVRACRAEWPTNGEWILLTPILCIIVLLSIHTGLNKHSRYLLPVIPLCIVWLSQCASQAKTSRARTAIALCLLVSVVSSVRVFPHSMSYFNELVGGAEKGWLHLSSSNVDWGEDIFFLKEELKRRDWKEAAVVCYTKHHVEHIGMSFKLPPFHPSISRMKRRLTPGKYAVSVIALQGIPFSAPTLPGEWESVPPHAYSYFREFQPAGMVGYSIMLYDLSESDIAQSPTWSRSATREGNL